jgi:uncharacterized damage-inducible protein DinB
MSPRIRWTDRRFDFSFPVDLYPEVIERVRGTPARLTNRLSPLPTAVLTRRKENSWSIQENAGHLLDLESLFAQRLDEYLAGVGTLHAADMSNRKTHEAQHNESSVDLILAKFREERGRLVERLDGLDPESFGRIAIHPRLNTPMRLVDMLFFQAEHDDYHLARISDLVRLFADHV